MREFASLLLVVALAAPFGDAGALSLAGAHECLTAAAAHADNGQTDPGQHVGDGSPLGARTYVPGQTAYGSTVADGLGGGLKPRVQNGASATPLWPAQALGRIGRARSTSPAPSGSASFFEAFAAHPSTAPPIQA